jgi:3-phosphoshikimate 1-carboxyvinyltransferase
VEMISKAGACVAEEKAGFTITGSASLHTGDYSSHGDHRIAMSSAILSLAAHGESKIRDTVCVATSFPDFPELLQSLSRGCLSVFQDS